MSFEDQIRVAVLAAALATVVGGALGQCVGWVLG